MKKLIVAAGSSAVFWCLVLAVLGAALIASGVSIVVGNGYGLITLGAFFVLGAAVIRNGIIRA